MNQSLKINFQSLYRTAQFSTLVMLVLIPMQIIIFVIAPPPNTVKGFFELFNQNPFLGLLSLDFIYLFNNIILVIIYLALFMLLYREKLITVFLALILGLIGISCYYPSNPAFEMLTLSNKFFHALPDQQDIYLVAGEAVMSSYTGTAFNTYYVLSTICLLLFSYALIKSPRFKKSLGLWGLLSGVFMIIPSSAGMIGMIFSLLSLIPWIVFIVLLSAIFKDYATTNTDSE